MTRGELIAELAASLGARHEARFIVEEVLGSTPSFGGQAVGTADVDAARSLAALRQSGEPLQYVLGHWAFRSLDLLVDGRVLIPRPETEQVVEVALGEVRRLAAAPVIVDAGTGSGAIALSMATELAGRCPEGRLWATDASAEALAVARANLDRVRRQHGGHVLPVTLAQGSWLDPASPGADGPGRSDRRQSSLRRRRDVAGSPRGRAPRAPRGAGGRSRYRRHARARGGRGGAVPGADVVGASGRRGDRAGAPAARGRGRHGPAHGVRRRPGGEGPGTTPTDPGRSCPVTELRIVGGRSRAEPRAALAEGLVIAVAVDGGYHLAALPGHPEAVAVARARSSTSLHEAPFQLMVGLGAQAMASGVGVEQGDAHPDRPHVAWPLDGRRADQQALAADGSGDGVVRITMPASRALRALCRACGPVALLALGHPDGRPLVAREEVCARFTGNDIALVVDGGPAVAPARPSSTARRRPPSCAGWARSPRATWMRR